MSLALRFAEIFLLGLIGGSVPGPILTSVFADVLARGFKKSLLVVMKAMIAETLIAVLILFIFFWWDIPEIFFYVISFGGAIVLFWLAKQVWSIEKIATDKKKNIFTFPKLLLLTLLNGSFWIFWITICVPRAFELNEMISGGHLFFIFFMELGWFISTAGLGYIFSRFRPLLLKKKFVSTIFKIFAFVLVFFGLKSMWGSFLFFTTNEVGSHLEKGARFAEFDAGCAAEGGSIEAADDYYCVTDEQTCSYTDFVGNVCMQDRVDYLNLTIPE